MAKSPTVEALSQAVKLSDLESLSTDDLAWIEAQVPTFQEPFAKLLVLILLLDARKRRAVPIL